MDPLESAILKAEWAYQHLIALETDAGQALNPDGKGIAGNLDTDSSRYLFHVNVSKAIMNEWRLRIGDIVTNLRDSLDHIAYQLALQTTKDLKVLETIYFPVNERKDGNFLSRTKHFKPEAVKETERFQPYNTGGTNYFARNQDTGVSDGSNPKSHVLWVINELTRIDKHRHITIMPMQVAFQGFNNRDNGHIHVRWDDTGVVAEVFGTFNAEEKLEPRVTIELQVEIFDMEANATLHYNLATLHQGCHVITKEVIPAFVHILSEHK